MSKTLSAAWLVLGGLVLAGSPAGAQDVAALPSADPILQALVAEALDRNPDLLAAQSAIAAARTRPEQAGALPDPMVSMSFTNDGWAPSLGRMPMTTLAVMGSQNLPWPGKRQLRTDMAGRDVALAEQRLARARLGITAGIKRAYYGLVLARELRALTQGQRELWQNIEVVARERYAVGQGAQQDVLRVQVEVTRVEQRAAEQSAEADIRLAEINRLTARPSDAALGTPTRLALQPLVIPLAAMVDQANAISPEAAAARILIERDRLAVAIAQKASKPDFSVQAGYMNRGGLDPVWLAGVGINLPVNRKARASAVAESKIAITGSERLAESLGLQLRYRTQERFTRAKTVETIISLYDQGLIPQDRMTVEAAVANYQTGTVPFVSVLEAMTTLYADRWTRDALVAEHAGLVASLEEASLEATAGMATAEPVRAGGANAVTGASGGMADR